MLSFIDRVIRNKSGNVAIIFSLALVPVIGAVGGAGDFLRAYNIQRSIQHAADAAALAAISVNRKSEKEKIEFGKEIFAVNLQLIPSAVASNPSVSIDENIATVSTKASAPTFLINILGIDELDVSVSARATRALGPPICLLSLNPDQNKSIRIQGSAAAVTAHDCAVHANSSGDEAIYGKSRTISTAAIFCAHGGYIGDSFEPTPISSCPIVEDPHSGLTPPNTEGCDYKKKEFDDRDVTISPGIYCDGLKVKSDSILLEPGIYVIKDGALEINSDSIVAGKGVLFYLTGEKAALKIAAQAKIDLSAPVDGPYTGFVLWMDPDVSGNPANMITGHSGINIVGTLYFPKHALEVSGAGDFGADSPYLAIVADSFIFSGNGTMTVRLDKESADFDELFQAYAWTGSRLIE